MTIKTITLLVIEGETLYDFYTRIGDISGSGTHVVTGVITITPKELVE